MKHGEVLHSCAGPEGFLVAEDVDGILMLAGGDTCDEYKIEQCSTPINFCPFCGYRAKLDAETANKILEARRAEQVRQRLEARMSREEREREREAEARRQAPVLAPQLYESIVALREQHATRLLDGKFERLGELLNTRPAATDLDLLVTWVAQAQQLFIGCKGFAKDRQRREEVRDEIHAIRSDLQHARAADRDAALTLLDTAELLLFRKTPGPGTFREIRTLMNDARARIGSPA
jgi:hypothetical protein